MGTSGLQEEQPLLLGDPGTDHRLGSLAACVVCAGPWIEGEETEIRPEMESVP